MSPVLNTLEAGYLLEAGRHEEARARLARALAIAPGFWFAHCTQGVLHFADGQPDEGIARLRAATVLAEGNSRSSALLAVYLARLGQVDEARVILGRLLDLARARYVPPSSIAAAYAALGETTPALDALDQAVLTRDTRLVFVKDDSRLAGLRKEPRFAALLHRLKLDGFGPGLAPP
jgi:tetratricopeptide (TPR) repeat protein